MTRRGLVIDTETVPDRAALAACGVTARAAQGRVWLHRLAAVALFEFEETRDGAISQLRLESLLVAPEDVAGEHPNEFEALTRIEDRLAGLGKDSVVVSFNGRRHDLPFLQLRRRHWGAFAGSALDRYVGKEAQGHIDMMEALCAGGLRWPSLDEACAALGIPHSPHAALSTVPAPIRKCETDVLATFLLYLVDRAVACGSARCLLAAWTALAAWCLEQPGVAHRAQFATAATARAAIRAARAG